MRVGQIQSSKNLMLIERMDSIYNDTIQYHNIIRAEMVSAIEKKQISQEQVDNIIVVLERYRTIAQNISALKIKLITYPNTIFEEEVIPSLLDITQDTLQLNMLINSAGR